MRWKTALFAAAAMLAALALAACGGTSQLIGKSSPSVAAPSVSPSVKVQSKTPDAGVKLGFPLVATKNTTRVAGSDPVADAAGVALAVFPSQTPGTHPSVVTLAPTDDWQAAIAASALMAPPIRAPVLLSGSSSLPSATTDALKLLAPTGSGVVAGAQVIRVGDVPSPSGFHSQAISGTDPYALAASIDRFASAARGSAGGTVVIASGDNPAYAMPAAGWAAESGDPVLFVKSSSIPSATAQALLAHQRPHIYVLGPPSVISDAVLTQLRKYGTVKRVGGAGSGGQLGRVCDLPRSALPLRSAVRTRARQLRLGNAEPRARVRAAQLLTAARCGRGRAAVRQRRLRTAAACRERL